MPDLKDLKKYSALSGKNCHLLTDILATSDQEALRQASEIVGVRLVVRIADRTALFEDYDNPLSKDHPIFKESM